MTQKPVIFLAVFVVVSANICFATSFDANDTAIPIEENGYKIIRLPEGDKPVSGNLPKRKPNRLRIVIGGQSARRHEFPFKARLVTNVNGGSYYGCGASIISERFILTAAHCVIIPGKTLTKILVYAGDHGSTIRGEPGEQVVEGAYVVTAGYNPSTIANDIAIIKLRSDLVLGGSAAQKVCLASGSHTYAYQTGIVIGWGGLSHGGPSARILQKLNTKIISPDECRQRAGYSSGIPERICMVNTKLKGVCHGDSGGPMIVVENGRYKQVGIASYITARCGTPNKPSVYTRVSAYRRFIENQVRSGLAC